MVDGMIRTTTQTSNRYLPVNLSIVIHIYHWSFSLASEFVLMNAAQCSFDLKNVFLRKMENILSSILHELKATK